MLHLLKHFETAPLLGSAVLLVNMYLILKAYLKIMRQ